MSPKPDSHAHDTPQAGQPCVMGHAANANVPMAHCHQARMPAGMCRKRRATMVTQAMQNAPTRHKVTPTQ